MGINKDIALCMPVLQTAWAYLKAQWDQLYPDGSKLILVETFRSAAVQTAYYAQGRQPLAAVNKLRQTAGLYLLDEAENKRKITFKPAGNSKHERRPSEAFDIGFIKIVPGTGGKPKQVMDYSPGNYDKAAAILRPKFPNVVWGADWNRNGKTSDETFVDRPHFQA